MISLKSFRNLNEQNLINIFFFRGLKKIVTPLFAGLLGGEMNFDRFFQEVTAIVIHKCVALFCPLFHTDDFFSLDNQKTGTFLPC
jgi:hypothetical protein